MDENILIAVEVPHQSSKLVVHRGAKIEKIAKKLKKNNNDAHGEVGTIYFALFCRCSLTLQCVDPSVRSTRIVDTDAVSMCRRHERIDCRS